LISRSRASCSAPIADDGSAHEVKLKNRRPVEKGAGAAVPARLGGHAVAVAACEAHRGHDVVGVGSLDDRGGVLVDMQVPGGADLVPVGVGRRGDLTLIWIRRAGKAVGARRGRCGGDFGHVQRSGYTRRGRTARRP
jgi:hypothetical protein